MECTLAGNEAAGLVAVNELAMVLNPEANGTGEYCAWSFTHGEDLVQAFRNEA